MKKRKVQIIILAVAIFVVAGMHISKIIQFVSYEAGRADNIVTEPSQGQINRELWEKEGVMPYLEEYYSESEIETILAEMDRQLYYRKSGFISGKDLNSLDWPEFVSAMSDMKYAIVRWVEGHSDAYPVTFEEWFYGDY